MTYSYIYAGVESITMDMKEKKLTVTGDIDPVDIVGKLRKLCHTDIVSVGPAKEPEKKKEEPKKEAEKKKEEPKNGNQVLNAQLLKAYHEQYLQQHQQYYQQQHQPLPILIPTHYRSMEEDPNACVIC